MNQPVSEVDPTATVSPIHFKAIFNEAVMRVLWIWNAPFTGSTAGGTLVATVTEIVPNNGTTYDVSVAGMTQRGTVVASIPAGQRAGRGRQHEHGFRVDGQQRHVGPRPGDDDADVQPGLAEDERQPSGLDHDQRPGRRQHFGRLDLVRLPRRQHLHGPDQLERLGARRRPHRLTGPEREVHVPTSCTGTLISPLNPRKGDLVFAQATPNHGLFQRLGSDHRGRDRQHDADGDARAAETTFRRTRGTTYTNNYSISDADGDTIASVATSCARAPRRTR